MSCRSMDEAEPQQRHLEEQRRVVFVKQWLEVSSCGGGSITARQWRACACAVSTARGSLDSLS